MNECEISMLRSLILAIILGASALSWVQAVPVEPPVAETATPTTIVNNTTSTTALVESVRPPEAGSATNASTEAMPQDLETAGSEKVESSSNNFVGTVGALAEPDNEPAASNINPAIYAGLLTPDAFQQYVSQFGPAAAYVPYGAAYPAPIGYGPVPPPPPPPSAIYPSPIVVQTNYDGFLVPTTTAATTSSTTAAATTTTTAATTTQTGILALLAQLLPALMMSTLFRVFAAAISMLGMLFFSNAIGQVICNYTPICDMSFQAVTYMRRRGGAERVGRMIAEEITPERVRRATEFVRGAIRKYRQLQKVVGEGE